MVALEEGTPPDDDDIAGLLLRPFCWPGDGADVSFAEGPSPKGIELVRRGAGTG